MNNVEKYTGLKRENLLNKSGIYKITCKNNNKSYVGYATCLYDRIRCHIKDFNKGMHCNKHLLNTVKKYSIESLIWEILELCEKSELCKRENYWAKLLNVHNKKYGFNIKPTSDDIYIGHSKETIERIRLKNIGKKLSIESKKRISDSRTGIKVSKEGIEKIKAERKKRFKKSILVFDHNSNFIKKYDYYREYIEEYNLWDKPVKYTLNRNLFVYKNHIIVYENIKYINLLKNRIKLIAKYNENMEIIKIYTNATEVAKQEKIDNSYISKVCRKGGGLTGKGFFKFITSVNIENNKLSYN